MRFTFILLTEWADRLSTPVQWFQGSCLTKIASKIFDGENREHSQTERKIMIRDKIIKKKPYKLIKVLYPNYHRQNTESIFQRISVEFSGKKKYCLCYKYIWFFFPRSRAVFTFWNSVLDLLPAVIQKHVWDKWEDYYVTPLRKTLQLNEGKVFPNHKKGEPMLR